MLDARARGDIEFEMKVMSVFDSTQFLVEMYGSGICEGEREGAGGGCDDTSVDSRALNGLHGT